MDKTLYHTLCNYITQYLYISLYSVPLIILQVEKVLTFMKRDTFGLTVIVHVPPSWAQSCSHLSHFGRIE